MMGNIGIGVTLFEKLRNLVHETSFVNILCNNDTNNTNKIITWHFGLRPIYQYETPSSARELSSRAAGKEGDKHNAML